MGNTKFRKKSHKAAHTQEESNSTSNYGLDKKHAFLELSDSKRYLF